MIRALGLTPGPAVALTEVSNDLHGLRACIGGNITTIGLRDGAVMIANADAENRGLKHNPIASLIARRQIYGPVLLVGADGDDFDDVPDEYLVWLGIE